MTAVGVFLTGVELIILLLVAFIVSLIIKQLVLKIFNIKALKELISKLDSEEIDVDSNLSFINIFGDLAFWFTFLLFLIPMFTLLGLGGIAYQISLLTGELITIIPNIIFAVVIIIIGFFLANFLRRIVYILLLKTRVNELIKKVMLDEKKEIVIDACKIGSWTVYALVVLAFITQALDIFGLQVLSNISLFVVGLVPSILAALAIFLGAYILANFLSGVVKKSFNETKEAKVMAIAVRYFVLIMGIGMVLNQLGFNLMLLNATYIVILIVLGVAFAISFGVAGIDIARKILNKQYDKYDNK